MNCTKLKLKMDKTFYCKVCKRLIKLDECNACPNKELNIKQTKVIKPLTDEQKQQAYEKKIKLAQNLYENKLEKLKQKEEQPKMVKMTKIYHKVKESKNKVVKSSKVIKPLTEEQKQKVYEKKLKQAQSIYEKKIEKLKNQPFKEFIIDQEKNKRDFEKKLEKLKQKPKKEIVIDKEQLQEKYNEALNKAIEYNIKNYDKKKKIQEGLNKKVKKSKKVLTLEQERFSILTKDLSRCFLCGNKKNNLHEVYFGTNRQNSMKYGCVIPLCQECHTGNNGVHFNKDIDQKLKKQTQVIFEKTYKDLNFQAIFKKNYK